MCGWTSWSLGRRWCSMATTLASSRLRASPIARWDSSCYSGCRWCGVVGDICISGCSDGRELCGGSFSLMVSTNPYEVATQLEDWCVTTMTRWWRSFINYHRRSQLIGLIHSNHLRGCWLKRKSWTMVRKGLMRALIGGNEGSWGRSSTVVKLRRGPCKVTPMPKLVDCGVREFL